MLKIGVTSSKIVELTPEDLAAFERFKTILPDVAILDEAGVFSYKSGKAIIHRDADGKIQKIDVELVKYRAPHK